MADDEFRPRKYSIDANRLVLASEVFGVRSGAVLILSLGTRHICLRSGLRFAVQVCLMTNSRSSVTEFRMKVAGK